MREMYRTKNGSVHLSGGEVNLAILNANDPKEPGRPAGLYHFGFHVEDSAEWPAASESSTRKAPPKIAKRPMPKAGASDPDGNLFDISTVGWASKGRMDL